MKIGILSDIHGNHLALKAVLDELSEMGRWAEPRFI